MDGEGRMPRVAVGGLPYFGRRLAALLDGDCWSARYLETRAWEPRAALRTLRQARDADLVYLVGGQIERLSRPHLLRLALRTPFVMHWAGSDVLYARQARSSGRATSWLVRGVHHWAGAPWLADELFQIGVRARWLPHSWVDPPAVLPPLPAPDDAPFTVLTYLPEGRADFYGGEAVRQLAAALPDVQVLVTGAPGLPWSAPNVRCLGWVDEMAPLYARTHVLVRLPRHDGLAFMVQEALAFGRYAVWSYPFPGVLHAAGAEQAIAAVRQLRARHNRSDLPLNQAGAEHVRERFNRGRIRADLRAGLGALLR
jgi:hypothetical protein